MRKKCEVTKKKTRVKCQCGQSVTKVLFADAETSVIYFIKNDKKSKKEKVITHCPHCKRRL